MVAVDTVVVAAAVGASAQEDPTFAVVGTALGEEIDQSVASAAEGEVGEEAAEAIAEVEEVAVVVAEATAAAAEAAAATFASMEESVPSYHLGF